MESLPRKSPEQNGTGLDFGLRIDDRDYARPWVFRIRAGMSAWTPKEASYRIALPLQARERKRFLSGQVGEVMHGIFRPQQRMRQLGL